MLTTVIRVAVPRTSPRKTRSHSPARAPYQTVQRVRLRRCAHGEGHTEQKQRRKQRRAMPVTQICPCARHTARRLCSTTTSPLLSLRSHPSHLVLAAPVALTSCGSLLHSTTLIPRRSPSAVVWSLLTAGRASTRGRWRPRPLARGCIPGRWRPSAWPGTWRRTWGTPRPWCRGRWARKWRSTPERKKI